MKNLFQHSHKFSKGLFVNFSLQNKYDHESFIIALVPKRLKLIYLPLSTNYGAPQWALLQYIMDKVDFRSMRKTTKHLSFFLSFLPPSISFDEKKKLGARIFSASFRETFYYEVIWYYAEMHFDEKKDRNISVKITVT